MARVRTRPLALAVAAATLLSASTIAPAAAADSPRSAVRAFLEAVASRQLDDLGGLVCEPRQEAMRASFSDGTLGLDLWAEGFADLTLRLEQLEIETIEADDTSAEVHVVANLAVDVDEAGLRGFVRELLEVGVGPGELPVTEADIDESLPFLDEVLDLDRRIDDTAMLVLEDGAWVVCGGLEASTGPDDLYLTQPMVSTDGLCALAAPAELNELGPLDYDSSTGLGEICTYHQSIWDEYHAATLLLATETTLDEWREIVEPEGDLSINGAEGFHAAGAVFVDAGADVLQVTVSLPQDPPAAVDAVTQAVAIGELFLPRLDRLVRTGLELEAASSGSSLCEALPLRELNAASGRAFDGASGDPSFCSWTSSHPETELDFIAAVVTELTLEEFREILGTTTAGEIEGRPTISTPSQAVVELADGRTLDVSVSYDQRVEPTLPAHALALIVLEWLAPEVAPAPVR